MSAFNRAELTALGYVERVPGHWEKLPPSADAERVAATIVAESPYRSKWEAERAAYWEAAKRNGFIVSWRYEPFRLRLADAAYYKPDFLVQFMSSHPPGKLVVEEVKGHWREAALVRFKVARDLYPMFDFRAVTKRGGQWVDAMEGK